jgi:DNA-binding PadR family transcriptional regulator
MKALMLQAPRVTELLRKVTFTDVTVEDADALAGRLSLGLAAGDRSRQWPEAGAMEVEDGKTFDLDERLELVLEPDEPLTVTVAAAGGAGGGRPEGPPHPQSAGRVPPAFLGRPLRNTVVGGQAAAAQGLRPRPTYTPRIAGIGVPIYRSPVYAGGVLREPTFLILAAVAPAPLHGYGILQAVEKLSQGRVRLRAGTLYAALDRLVREGSLAVDREEVVDSRLRRYYRITDEGLGVLRRGVEQLEANVSAARGQLALRAEGGPA